MKNFRQNCDAKEETNSVSERPEGGLSPYVFISISEFLTAGSLNRNSIFEGNQ